MELREALCQISEIRRQMARGEVFRGYRAATIGYSGTLALIAAACQPHFIPSPQNDLDRYLIMWIGVAAISIVSAGSEMWWRARTTESAVTRQMARLAVEQFLPSVVVGTLITLCIYRAAPQVAWMLPALWSFVFSLGVFASCRLLPWQVSWVGVYYAVCGVACLLWGQGESVLSPWQMAISFGGGQLLAAAVLYWTLERTDAAQI